MKLTIVLPLRNRHQFNYRFFKQVNALPFKLFIADGSNERLRSRDSSDYCYFGPDTTIARWFYKVSLALEMVETPYAMLADNDDLPTEHLSRCVAFLEDFPSYVCCSGRIQGFYMWPNKVTGPFSWVTKKYALFDTPSNHTFTNSWSYYAVYRTEALRQICREVHELNITDLQIHEKFHAMRALSLGKIQCLPYLTSYYRQYGTSQGAAIINKDWVRNILKGELVHDMQRVLDFMSHQGVDRDALEAAWLEWWRAFILRTYGPWAQLRRKAKRLIYA